MHEIIELDKKGLREFGLVGGSIVAVVFGFVLPILRHHSLSMVPWIIAFVLWVWAIVAPTTLNVVYQIWMRIGLVLGWIQTRIILGVLFYAMLTPMGLIKRLWNRDPMMERFEANLPTYRQLSQLRTKESMEKNILMLKDTLDFLKDLGGFVKERQKLLVDSPDYHSGILGCADYLRSIFGDRTVYLHPILNRFSIDELT